MHINRCTIRALEYTIDMVKETNDRDRLKELNAKIDVEYSKTDDIYAMVEKDVLQVMHNNYSMNEDNVNILKYIRKNLKIIDRLEALYFHATIDVCPSRRETLKVIFCVL